MGTADSTSHASLNGLYVKAQELERGHLDAPPWKSAAPGVPLGAPAEDEQAHASAHPSDASAQASDYSLEYTLRQNADDSSHSIAFRCFDVPNSITVYEQEAACGAEALDGLLLELKDLCLELHGLWSFSLEGSDVSRMNERRERTYVDPRTAQLVGEMLEFGRSEPLFDCTIGRLSFLFKRARALPSERAVEKLKSHTGMDKLHVEGSTICKSDVHVQVDVGGSAKGAAADMIAARLRLAGVGHAKVDLGGNLYLVGTHPSGRPWRLDVTIPHGLDVEGDVLLEAADASVVTSGNYERFVEIDGKRFQHIVDPRTGWPSESDVASATVVASSSLQADMIATTACLAGSDALADLAERHPECQITAILQDGTILSFNGE